MHETNRTRLDLNLLVVFDAVARTRSVTAAAQELFLSQPAVSHALNRLRDLVGDRLFLRGPGGLAPTPRAEAMMGPAREALAQAARAFAPGKFDPATTRRVFRVAASDYALATVAPALVALARAETPQARLELPAMREGALELLETGELDAAFWGASPPPRPWRSVELFRERLVGLVRARHPLAVKARAGHVALDDYLAHPHIAVSWRDPRLSAVDARLAEIGRARRIAVATPNFAANVAALRGADLVMSLPSRYCAGLDLRGLARFELPLALDDFAYLLVWHARTDDDAANVWLRAAVVRAAGQAGGAAMPPRPRVLRSAAGGKKQRQDG
jgi:DNA-binding transcriptional LysR family regulator